MFNVECTEMLFWHDREVQRSFVFLSLAELVTKLYEAAVRKVPTSEEYHSHLFMAYARVGEYKKMQQVCWCPSVFELGDIIRDYIN